MMVLVCQEGLRERHWTALEKATDISINVHPGTNVQYFVDIGINKHAPKDGGGAIETPCIDALKEFTIEKSLDAMEAEWKEPPPGIAFECKPWKSTGTPSASTFCFTCSNPDEPCTCSVVLNASIGVMRMRKPAAAHDEQNVFAASGIATLARRESISALAAVSPKREIGACSSAACQPW